jgi:hypothetical protein
MANLRGQNHGLQDERLDGVHADATPQKLLLAALDYAARGWRVLPLRGKLPYTKHGCKDATTDKATIRSWWMRWPNANIGIATGNGLMVVDLDGGADLPDQLEVPITPIARTGHGRHLYLRYSTDRPIGNRARVHGHTIDIRGEGGYVVAPPSVHPSGAVYTWERSPDDTPLVDAPKELLEWLAPPPVTRNGDARRRAERIPDTIPDGQRDTTLTSLAGSMRARGLGEHEILDALRSTNRRCIPPLDAADLARIARSVSKYPAPQHSNQEPKRFKSITIADLANKDLRVEYHIEDVLPARMPTIWTGGFKDLKTSTALDAAISIHTATPFLGRFPILSGGNAGYFSCEAADVVINEIARRICRAKGLKVENVALPVSFETPNLGRRDDLKALRLFVEDNGLRVLFLDPAYLLMPGVGDKANNLLVVGAQLRRLNALIEKTGVTIVLLHHITRTAMRKDKRLAPELGDSAWAGYAEWARAWVCIRRRKNFDPESKGEHKLLMATGGSTGHHGLFAVDITEGARTDPGGRRWDVQVRLASDVLVDEGPDGDDRKEAQKRDREQRREKQDEKELLAALDALVASTGSPAVSYNQVKTKSRLSTLRMKQAMARLRETIDEVTITVQCGKAAKEAKGLRRKPGSDGSDNR